MRTLATEWKPLETFSTGPNHYLPDVADITNATTPGASGESPGEPATQEESAPDEPAPDSTEAQAAELRHTFASSLLTTPELVDLQIPPRPRLLGNFFHEGDLGFIYAPRGGGKTWMAMMMAAARAKNEALGEWSAGDRPSRVLYVDGEMHGADTQSRCRALGLRADELIWLHGDLLFEKSEASLNLGLAAQQLAITTLCMDFKIRELYLDNLSCLIRGLKENDSDDWRELLLPWLLDLRRRKITVVVVHHAGRNGLMRGTSQREDQANWILKLDPMNEEDREGADFVSRFEKLRAHGSGCYPLRWTLVTQPDGTFERRCVRFSEHDEMLKHIREGVGKASELAELAGVAKGTISKWAKRLQAGGFITIERGVYKVV